MAGAAALALLFRRVRTLGVERLSDGAFLGQCGITMQPLYDTLVPEIGYVFDDEYWGFGYATEAAKACKKYGFEVMGAAELFSIIRGNNLPSIRVAERNGMTPRGTITKHYYNTVMPHIVYSVTRGEYDA